MNREDIKNIIREIIQSEIQPEPRGGGVQSKEQGMGMWHDENPFYHTKREEKEGFWHQGDDKKGKEPGETKQTPKNFPESEKERPSGQAKWDVTKSSK